MSPKGLPPGTSSGERVESHSSKRWPSWLETCVGVLVGLFFMGVAIPKIMDPGAFATSIKHFKLLPLSLVNAVALLLPWWEIAAGVGLLIPGWRSAGALLTAGLASVFLVAVGSALFRGLDITCGCFGEHSGKVGWPLFVLDSTLLFSSAWLLWCARGLKKAKCFNGK